MSLFQMEQHLVPILKAAFLRGATSQRELEIVARVHLLHMGFEVYGVPYVRAVHSGSGVRVYAELLVRPVPRGPAKVISIQTAREVRQCNQCSGLGCLWCKGQGWRRLKEA